MASIWVIEWHWLDNSDYRDMWETRLEEDFGYFITLEDAQAFCDEKNAFQRRLDAANEKKQAEYDARLAEYEERKRQNSAEMKFLAQNPDAPFKAIPNPHKPAAPKLLTLQEFTMGMDRWEPLEIEAAELVDEPRT